MRFNRMAMQFGVAQHTKQRDRNQNTNSSSENHKEEKNMDGKLSFHEMEDVVDGRGNQESNGFVVGGIKKEEPKPVVDTEVFIGDTEEAKKEQEMTEEKQSEVQPEVKTEEPANSGEKAALPQINQTVGQKDVPEQSGPQKEENENEDPEGYREAMDLLRLIDKHPDEAEMKSRYGEKWSLHGIIGLPFRQAETMLCDAKDYFSFHVGEIVALSANGKTAGVVIFVDGSSIGVFSGEKILSYRPELLKKTGRVFRDTVAACGLSM